MTIKEATIASKPLKRPRFYKSGNGEILDRLTGVFVCRVDVRHLDTATADRVSDVIIDALHREFGPGRTERLSPFTWL